MAGIALQYTERSVGKLEEFVAFLLVSNGKPVFFFCARTVIFHFGYQAQVGLGPGIMVSDRKRLMKRLRRGRITLCTVQNTAQVIPGIRIFAVHTYGDPEPLLSIRLVIQQHIIASNNAELFAVRLSQSGSCCECCQ